MVQFIIRHGNTFRWESRIIFERITCHKNKIRTSITAAILHILMTKAYEKHPVEKKAISDFKSWRKDKESQYPQFYF